MSVDLQDRDPNDINGHVKVRHINNLLGSYISKSMKKEITKKWLIREPKMHKM